MYVTPIVLGTYITRSFQKRRKAQTLDPMPQRQGQSLGAGPEDVSAIFIASETYLPSILYMCLLIGDYCLQEYTFPSYRKIKVEVLRSV